MYFLLAFADQLTNLFDGTLTFCRLILCFGNVCFALFKSSGALVANKAVQHEQAAYANKDRGLQFNVLVQPCEKEIHESDSFLTNLRENERLRRLRKSIDENKVKIDAFDMEEAARARRQFDDKYAVEKKREGDMEAEVCLSILCVLTLKMDRFSVFPAGR
jgi:hypothetical protein